MSTRDQRILALMASTTHEGEAMSAWRKLRAAKPEGNLFPLEAAPARDRVRDNRIYQRGVDAGKEQGKAFVLKQLGSVVNSDGIDIDTLVEEGRKIGVKEGRALGVIEGLAAAEADAAKVSPLERLVSRVARLGTKLIYLALVYLVLRSVIRAIA